jgi:thiosulfate/3-mercaptopyruvate sulfurtransferase
METGLTVSTAWLAANIDNPAIRIIDIRGHVLPASEPKPHYYAHLEEYRLSHIPGAVFVDWNADIIDAGTISGDVAQPEVYAALMSRLGVDEHIQVIAYDDANGMFAARLWWTLRYYGHESAAILDGGWDQWVREGRQVTAEQPQIEARVFVPRIRSDLRASIADVSECTVLIDVRTPAEFKGDVSRARRRGHIPGAINIPRSEMFNADGTLRAPDELRALFAANGITAQGAAPIVYCNAGVSASYGLLALQAAGIINGRVYDGSWKEWGNMDHLPIEP